MLRAALPLSVALLVLLGCGERASATRTVIPVDGEVRALAFSGDAIVVARVAGNRGLVLERLVAGAPAQTLLVTALESESDDYEAQVVLAASPQAIALSVKPGFLEEGPSMVLIGSPLGPLREVARCSPAMTVAPVAVAGSRIAWRDGGCGDARRGPTRGTPSAIVLGDADPSGPARRIALSPNRVPVALALAPGDTGIAGMLLPPYGIDGQLVPFSAAGPGNAIVTQRAGVLAPAGILGDGTRVYLRGPNEDERECDDSKRVFSVAPGATKPRLVRLGACVSAVMAPAPVTGSGPVAAGDRILAFAGAGRLSEAPDVVSLVSVRGDGGDRRELVRGTYRRPYGVATDGTRVAWWQPGRTVGGEIVVQDSPQARTTLASCRAGILTRSARLRAGRITVRLRCPAGCAGKAVARRLPDGRPNLREDPPAFSFPAGTHPLRVPIALGRHRSARVRVDLSIEHGPTSRATISVRR